MHYTDVRCGRCAAWRTALVGYGGARVCLACGEPLDAREPSAALARLPPTAWTDALWTDAAPLPPDARRERLRAWLAGRSVALPAAHVEALAHCDTAAELRFALPIVTLSTWAPVGERSFSDGRWTLRVGPVLAGQRVHFALQGPSGALPAAVLIERADPPPAGRREEGLAALALQAAGHPVMRLPAAEAARRGEVLRSALMREALEEIGGEVTAPPSGGRSVAAVGRIWSRHPLVYDAASLPRPRRRELVEDWLRSRGERLEPWQLDFLAWCERAGEVHFALPFLRLPGAEPADSRTVHLDPWHTLTAQMVVEDHAVDFGLTVSPLSSGEASTTLVEVLPARGARDRSAERARHHAWEAAGHAVLEIPAAEAALRGQRWAASLRTEPRPGRVRDAG